MSPRMPSGILGHFDHAYNLCDNFCSKHIVISSYLVDKRKFTILRITPTTYICPSTGYSVADVNSA